MQLGHVHALQNVHLYILACVGVCLFFVCIHVKTAELIGPKFCLGSVMTPRKVYGTSKMIFLENIGFY